MKVLVCGGSKYANRERVFEVLTALNENYGITHLIHGDCPTGADSFAKAWFRQNPSVPYQSGYPAKWDEYGRSEAGFKRNKLMFEESKPDLVVAFPGGRGTRSMVAIAKIGGCQVIQVFEVGPVNILVKRGETARSN
jgi:hypothetical protein